jgi:hypothetical protein
MTNLKSGKVACYTPNNEAGVLKLAHGVQLCIFEMMWWMELA